MTIRDEFKVHLLNQQGIDKARQLAEKFSELLGEIEGITNPCAANGREMALVRTHLQEASFFAKRALAMHPAHQVPSTVLPDEPTVETKLKP